MLTSLPMPKRSATASTRGSPSCSSATAIGSHTTCAVSSSPARSRRDGWPPIDVVVDFLMPSDAVIAKNNPPLVSNFAVQRGDRAELALNFYQMVAIDGGMPDGGRNLVSNSVASIPALLAMKGYAIAQRQKLKDAYDIYYCALYYPGYVDGLISMTLPLLEVDITRLGYRNIAGKFRTVDDYGPVYVRRFVDDSTLPRRADPQSVAAGSIRPNRRLAFPTRRDVTHPFVLQPRRLNKRIDATATRVLSDCQSPKRIRTAK